MQVLDEKLTDCSNFFHQKRAQHHCRALPYWSDSKFLSCLDLIKLFVSSLCDKGNRKVNKKIDFFLRITYFFRNKYSDGRQSAISDRSMTNLGQDWVCGDRRKHYLGRQSTISDRRMTNLGQERVCDDRRKHYVGRQSAISNGRMTNLGQNWVCDDRRKHCLGRQSALSGRRMTNLGQERVCANRRKHCVGRQSALSERRMTNLGADWSSFDIKSIICKGKQRFTFSQSPTCCPE